MFNSCAYLNRFSDGRTGCAESTRSFKMLRRTDCSKCFVVSKSGGQGSYVGYFMGTSWQLFIIDDCKTIMTGFYNLQQVDCWGHVSHQLMEPLSRCWSGFVNLPAPKANFNKSTLLWTVRTHRGVPAKLRRFGDFHHIRII